MSTRKYSVVFIKRAAIQHRFRQVRTAESQSCFTGVRSILCHFLVLYAVRLRRTIPCVIQGHQLLIRGPGSGGLFPFRHAGNISSGDLFLLYKLWSLVLLITKCSQVRTKSMNFLRTRADERVLLHYRDIKTSVYIALFGSNRRPSLKLLRQVWTYVASFISKENSNYICIERLPPIVLEFLGARLLFWRRNCVWILALKIYQAQSLAISLEVSILAWGLDTSTSYDLTCTKYNTQISNEYVNRIRGFKSSSPPLRASPPIALMLRLNNFCCRAYFRPRFRHACLWLDLSPAMASLNIWL